MTALRLTASRLLALIAILAMVAVACTPAGEEAAPEGEAPAATGEEAPAATGGTGEGQAAAGGGEFENYQTAIFEDITTDNIWAYLGPDATVYTGYALAPTAATLYDVATPFTEGVEAAGQIIPEVAMGEPVDPVQEGDVWVVEQPLQEGLTWSDGEAITAEDFAFTAQTVLDLNLSGNWASFFPEAAPDSDAIGITAVEAVDESTVRIEFNQEPGLAVWPHSVGLAYIMPEHYWGPIVDEAKSGAQDAEAQPNATPPVTKEAAVANAAAQELFGASGAEAPSGGPMVYAGREEGAFVRLEANAEYYDDGQTVRLFDSGAVELAPPEGEPSTFGGEEAGGEAQREYTIGPYAQEQTLSVYGSQDASVLALREGEVSYLLNSLGMQRGLQQQVINDQELQAIINPTYGFRYLAFNTNKFPMSDPAFRRAVAFMIDRNFMADSVLQGVAYPTYTTMPPGNAAWYNEEVAGEIAQRYEGQFEARVEEVTGQLEEGQSYTEAAARLEAAVQVLEDAGYTWETRPSYDRATDTITSGVGLTGPDGQNIGRLNILSPTAGYDPLRATYAIYIEQWMNELGIQAAADPTGFNAIVSQIFTAPPAKPDYDLYILGWSLGNPALPDYYASFWTCGQLTAETGGFNNTGYCNEDFDQLANSLLTVRSEEEAFDAIWEMEQVLAEDLPYVVLFGTPILEFYRSAEVSYPFTEELGGLQFLNGVPELVQAAE